MNENAIFNEQLTAFFDTYAETAKSIGAGFAGYFDVSLQGIWDLDAFEPFDRLSKATWIRLYNYAVERYEAVTGEKADTSDYSLDDLLRFAHVDEA